MERVRLDPAKFGMHTVTSGGVGAVTALALVTAYEDVGRNAAKRSYGMERVPLDPAKFGMHTVTWGGAGAVTALALVTAYGLRDQVSAVGSILTFCPAEAGTSKSFVVSLAGTSH